MPIILDGKKARDFYKDKLVERVLALKNAYGVTPRLAIIQISDNRESSIYIGQKNKFAAAIGASVDHIKFAESVSQKEVEGKIAELNADSSIHGIIVQMPVPAHLDKLALMNAVDPRKDVDGLTDENQRLLEVAAHGGKITRGDNTTPLLIPATAKGVMFLLDFYKIPIAGKKIVVFGRSRLVGHPIAELLKCRGAHVAVCHSKTPNPEEVACTADILVIAIGKPKHIGTSYIKEGAVVVDVGINSVQVADGAPRHLEGDVDFAHVSTHVSAISPVPGGVGPMTVLSLFDNLVVSAEGSIRSKN